MLEAETMVDRRRLRRRLTLWRLVAVVFALLFIAALTFGGQRMVEPAGFLPHIARISVSAAMNSKAKTTATSRHSVSLRLRRRRSTMVSASSTLSDLPQINAGDVPGL